MSGSNPFRRSILSQRNSIRQDLGQDETAETADIAEHLPPQRPAAFRQENLRPSSGTKIVRIASPPTTPQRQEYIPDSQHHASTDELPRSPRQSSVPRLSPYSSTQTHEVYLVNPFEVDTQEQEEPVEEELLNNTRTNSSVLVSAPEEGVRRPVNPFQKHGAKSEAPSETVLFTNRDKPPRRPLLVGKVGSGSARASLDVDSFQRLIMTGEKGITSSGTPLTPPAQNLTSQSFLGDSSSNTDASSISRQSTFESITGTAADTPRTSHEISVSDDEFQQLVGASSPHFGTNKSYSSAVRSQKPVTDDTPETVLSVHKPEQSSCFEKAPSMGAQAYTASAQSSQMLVGVNKPLPLPPESVQSGQSERVRHDPSKPEDLPSTSHSTSPLTTPHKKRPPTPPLARRQSQLRSSKPLLPRSNSVKLTPRPVHSFASFAQSDDTRTPPPPPIRRTLPDPSRSSLETSIHRDVVPASSPPSSTGLAGTIRQYSSRPPLPPARTRSISSIKRPHRPPPGASSAVTAPPVPPPRNRGSSQSSLDSAHIVSSSALSGDELSPGFRHLNIESQDQLSGGPIQQLSNKPSLVPESSANDILADLSVLQKEVDELRGMYEVRRASE